MNILRLTVTVSAVLAPFIPGIVLSQSSTQVQTTPSNGSSAVDFSTPVTFPAANSGAPSPGDNLSSPGINSPTPGTGSNTPGAGINPSGSLSPTNGSSTSNPTGTANPGTANPGTVNPTNGTTTGTVTGTTTTGAPQTIPLGGTQTGVNQPYTTAPTTQNQGTSGINQPGSTGTLPGNVQIIPGSVIPAPQTTPSPAATNSAPASTAPNRVPTSQPSTTRTNPTSQTPTLQPQQGQGTLDSALLQATCAQDWQRAIRIVNTAIAAAPANQSSYRTTLVSYRNRLQRLQANGVRVPNWQQQCGGNLANR